MKRLISSLVAVVIFVAAASMIPAYAEENIEEPLPDLKNPQPEYISQYSPVWSEIAAENGMQSYGTGDDSDISELYTVTADTGSLSAQPRTDYDTEKYPNGYEPMSYFSADMIGLSATTRFEYVFSGKNSREGGYSGFVFAYDTEGYPYILYGATDNKSATDGESEIIMVKGSHSDVIPSTEPVFMALDTDAEGFGAIKIVYDGYDVSVYGLTNADENTYILAEKASFTLPEGSKIALGIYCAPSTADGDCTPVLKNATLISLNRESSSVLKGDPNAKAELGALIDLAYAIDSSLYSDESYKALEDKLLLADGVYNDGTTDEEFTAALADVDAAIKSLKTVEEALKEVAAAAKALDDAKNIASIALSAKRENTGKVFTDASYAKYSAAYDEIAEAIKNAVSIESLNGLDIAALKVAAERLLVVNIPTEDDELYEGSATEAPADIDKDVQDDGDEDYETGSGGCLSSAVISALAIVGLLGTALVVKKRK